MYKSSGWFGSQWCETTRLQHIDSLKKRVHGYFMSEVLELHLLHQSLQPSSPFLCSPPWFLILAHYLTPLRQHNSLFSRTTTAAVLSAWPVHPLCCSATAANLLCKGQEGPSLARCLMGSDSSVFWDYSHWKGGHSSTGGFCHSMATVYFWQDSCSKPSWPQRRA